MVAVVYPGTDDYVSHLLGVRASLAAEGSKIAARARVLLAQHRDTGAARIEESSGRLDRFVSLSDERGYPAAGAIEYGHLRRDGTFVEGLHVMARAARG